MIIAALPFLQMHSSEEEREAGVNRTLTFLLPLASTHPYTRTPELLAYHHERLPDDEERWFTASLDEATFFTPITQLHSLPLHTTPSPAFCKANNCNLQLWLSLAIDNIHTHTQLHPTLHPLSILSPSSRHVAVCVDVPLLTLRALTFHSQLCVNLS